MNASRIRIDQLLTNRGIAPSRSRARDMLARNCVTVEGNPISKAGTLVADTAEVSVTDPALNYVSRAALKLKAGLDAAKISVTAKSTLDLGASTGGFTQVLLEKGASSVLAIDVGHGQMAPQIEADPKVTSLEGFNARALTAEHLSTPPSIIVSDVSFVSLILAAEPALRLAAPEAAAVLLIKPQFEVGKDGIGKGGLVKSPELASQAVDRICNWFTTLPGWEFTTLIPPPFTAVTAIRNFYYVERAVPEILIDNVGSLGDGMGQLRKQTVYVPMTLAGELVEVEGDPPHLIATEIITPSPDRIAPICQHFATCGGCSLQHMAADKMLEWKRAEVKTAFSRAGIDVEVEPCIASPARSRRRVTFTVKRAASEIHLGFNQRSSNEVVNIAQCPILLPQIESHLGTFRKLAATLLRGNEEIQIAINACDNGLELNFFLEQVPSEEMMAGFVRSFAKTPFLRAAINGDIVAEKEKPLVSFEAAQIAVPPGGFLQAVQSAEQAMADLVCAHLKSRKKVVDLFSGSGTFSLRLAKASRVHAVETETGALAALTTASGTDGLKPITTQKRDLEELPLMASELKSYDGVCLDPPRAGAAPQIKEITKTNIRKIAYVSCNPTTLARDAKALINGGYTLDRVTPIDQFTHSPHIEVVALLSKKPEKASRSIFR